LVRRGGFLSVWELIGAVGTASLPGHHCVGQALSERIGKPEQEVAERAPGEQAQDYAPP
jgi:hypothetical protein